MKGVLKISLGIQKETMAQKSTYLIISILVDNIIALGI